MIVATRPDPTVRPPSRIAKVRPCSIAIGWISSMVISTLSPGMHISVPSGRLITPVTSVVQIGTARLSFADGEQMEE